MLSGSPLAALLSQRLQHGSRFFTHHVHESLDLLAVEDGLHQAALLEPEIAIAEQQSVPDQVADGLEALGFLVVIVVVRLEDVLHAFRAADLNKECRPSPELRNRPVLG